jgi:hypothetical protein
MSDEDVLTAEKAAPGLALTLFHNSLVAGLSARREQEAVTAVLLGDADAARTLHEASDFPQGEPVTVLVARPLGEPDDSTRLALQRALLGLRYRFASRRPLHAVRRDHGVLIVAGRPVDLRAAIGVPVAVGIGRPRPTLAESAESYREALHAAEVAARIPSFGPVAEWSDLGIYRLLRGIPTAELHPGVERLLADRQHLPLLETLETYLDLAGSVVATSRALRLHRTSLYYRLQRVEKLAGTDLKDGEARLVLHLSLKLARLAGRYRPRHAGHC